MSLLVYKSSAGSGKTTTLVNEFLSIALPKPESFRNIIALTFTIKATTEMKERVLKVLAKLIRLEDYRDDAGLMAGLEHIKKKTGLREDKIRENAKILLGKILHHYSDFAFSTIDSFVVQIVRSFSHDLNLPNDFNIELDSGILIEQGVSRLLEKTGYDNDLTDFLIDYILQNLDNEKSFRIQSELEKLSKLLFDSSNFESVEKLDKLNLSEYKKIISKYQKELLEFENTAGDLAKEILDLIDSHHIPHKLFSRSTFPGQLKKIIDRKFDFSHPFFSDPYKYISYAKAKKEAGKSIELIKTELVKRTEKLINHLEENRDSYVSKKLILEQLSPTALLGEIKRMIEEYSTEQNLIHLSESNKKISEIVMNEHIPFIYERVGKRYNHFLVDEFQDTSQIQWQNLLPLIDNSLASDNLNMIVGDAKQSIYRWRGGEVEQFIKLPAIEGADKSPILKERENTLKRHYRAENLDTNYRSELNLIEFNNLFINYLLNTTQTKDKSSEFRYSDFELINKVYEDFNQKAGKKKDNGKVVIRNIPKNTEDKDAGYEQLLVEQIQSLLALNYELKDIALIARKNDLLHRAADILVRNGFNIVSSETLFIQNNPDVRLLVSVFSYLISKEQKNNLLNIILLLSKKNKENSAILRRSKELIDRLKTEDSARLLSDIFDRFGYQVKASHLKEYQTYELAEYLIERLELNRTANPFLQSLLNYILENAQRNGAGHKAFYEFWEQKKGDLSISLPENINAIKLLSIHKSKGLEFPVVIFPACGFNRKGEAHWVDPLLAGIDELETALIKHKKELQYSAFSDIYEEEESKMLLDELNLIYVANTRAAEQLILISDENQPNPLWKIIKGFGEQSHPKLTRIDDDHFEFGEMTVARAPSPMQAENKLEKLISNEWGEKIQIKSHSSKNTTDENRLEKIRRGTVLHEILGEIEDVSQADAALQRAILKGLISIHDFDFYKDKIREVTGHPELQKYFNGDFKVLNEINILTPSGLQKRPDKLLIRGNSCVIIDYKLSDYKEISESEKHKHFKQLNEYSHILKDMGFRNIEAKLLYLENKTELINVPQQF